MGGFDLHENAVATTVADTASTVRLDHSAVAKTPTKHSNEEESDHQKEQAHQRQCNSSPIHCVISA